MTFKEAEIVILINRSKKAIYLMAAPLVLGFAFVDYFYANDLFFDFLKIRLFIIPVCLLVFLFFHFKLGEKYPYIPIFFVLGFLSLYNSYMTAHTGYEYSLYYVGFLLATIGSISFFPFSIFQMIASTLILYFPYYFVVFLNPSGTALSQLIPITSFIISTVTLSITVNLMSTSARRNEFEILASEKKKNEALEALIKLKQDQAVVEYVIGNNFTDEIANRIRNDPSVLKNGSRRKTVPFFYDIVKSTLTTKKANLYNYQDELDELIIACNEILKFRSMAIGQFLGDGQIAFANAPFDVPRYVYLAIKAGIDIQRLIIGRRPFTRNKLGFELKLRIAMSHDFAFCKCAPTFGKGPYTVTGNPVNFAARICSIANPDTILVPKNMLLELSNEELTDVKLNTKIRLFNRDDILSYEGEIFQLVELSPVIEDSLHLNCPKCRYGSLIEIDKLEDSSYYQCSNCDYKDLI